MVSILQYIRECTKMWNLFKIPGYNHSTGKFKDEKRGRCTRYMDLNKQIIQ